ncbi:hypothetical protein N7G274_001743 [Stereocaulon virgatum]|uniref:AB hydrolase-1 domain-containing protein n=1 Tax=Stereocaulon virgatum TaxID=373712 RepID=A0ABR4AN99_9LECA
MSENLWHVIEYIIPGSHIRGYRRGVRHDQTDHVRLSIKQYIPKARKPNHGDPTLIIAHGIGSGKENHEPLLDDILGYGIPVRTAWAIDAAHLGQSYLLNEVIIGDEPHWLDPARDIIQMINHFQKDMPPPIYGIGQSWGCVNVLMISHFHPRLLAGMVLMEAPFENAPWDQVPSMYHRMALSARRRNSWPSREAARKYMLRSPYYSAFDPRALDRVIKHDLRDMPTPEHPQRVILTAPKAQEVYSLGRPDPPLPGHDAAPDYKSRPGYTVIVPGIYRGENKHIRRVLPDIKIPVLYLFGTRSHSIGASKWPNQIHLTGIGDEGGGGSITGQVKTAYVEGAGHALPMEKPAKCAELITSWLRPELEKWKEEDKRVKEGPSFEYTAELSPGWLQRIPVPKVLSKL